ncbi:MAG: glycosyl hydrolase [Sphingobacteriaceae bacterium]|nr:glycosyl hydrolase [Sphingobacteriaceae bacterium]
MLIATACKKKETTEATETSSVKATWGSTDKWAYWNNGGYRIGNNVWGNGAGPQSIWANSYSNWGVWANHPSSPGGVKSYPNSTRFVERTNSSLASCRSSFNVATPSGGAWSACYDIWAGFNKQYETMLWMNYTGNSNGSGNVRPISYNWSSTGAAVPTHTNQSIGGHTWNVFRGSNGAGATTFSFLRTSKTNSGTVDILAIQRWIQARGWFGNETLREVGFGFEISSTNGGQNFGCNSYSVSFN